MQKTMNDNRETIRHTANAAVLHGDYPRKLHSALSPQDGDRAIAEISGWPQYAPTPLRKLAAIAKRADVREVFYKDESCRFAPVKSFKALGGGYAAYTLLAEKVFANTGRIPSAAELAAGKCAMHLRGVVVCAATDGNHGRALAWGAKKFGCECRIFIHAMVSEERKRAMESLGAKVVRIGGDYDESVRVAATESEKNNWNVVSDTSYPGYEEIPRRVMAGYCAMADEVLKQTADSFSHVFLQGGVGGLAAAVCFWLWHKLGAHRPRVVVVEPAAADCLYQSALCGEMRAVKIREETMMAGLSCGEPSPLAWKILHLGAHDFTTIADETIPPLMRELANDSPSLENDSFSQANDSPTMASDSSSQANDSPFIESGESAPAGLAAFVAAAADESLRDKLKINSASRILTIGTEGATAPELYKKITGKSAAE